MPGNYTHLDFEARVHIAQVSTLVQSIEHIGITVWRSQTLIFSPRVAYQDW